MKPKFALFPIILFLLNCYTTGAQSFTVLTDTFYLTATPYITLHPDSVIIKETPVTFDWQVRACNFPADWADSTHDFLVCDNSYCRYLSSIWPSVTSDSTFQYAAHDTGVLTLVMNLPDSATKGCYYITVRLRNNLTFTDIASETWIICNGISLSVPQNVNGEEFLLYPNPVKDILHVSCKRQIAQVVIYNTIGEKLKTVVCANGDTSVLLNDLSTGIYVACLIDTNGITVAKKKIIKD